MLSTVAVNIVLNFLQAWVKCSITPKQIMGKFCTFFFYEMCCAGAMLRFFLLSPFSAAAAVGKPALSMESETSGEPTFATVLHISDVVYMPAHFSSTAVFKRERFTIGW